MPASATTTADRDPRRARSLSPGDTPRRGERAAALAAAGLLAHLLLAQLTLLLAVALDLTGRAARWRPLWLAGPAAAGFLWVLAIGPGRALAGFTDGPHQVLGYLAGAAGQPARALHPARAFAGIRRWLPRQAPVALVLAPAEAAAAGWLRTRRAGERGLPPPRPGLIVAVRRLGTVVSVRSGGVVTRTGACLGVDWRTGRPAGISWRAAEGGVLVTGAAAAGVSEASFQLVHAAIRRRKPVLVVDLGGTGGLDRLDGLDGPAGLAGALASVCADTGAPLHVFGPAGQGCYEPLRGGDPARKAALVMGMIDWGPVADHARRTCGAYLNDLFAVAAAAPADQRLPVLDDVAALLRPAALRARMRQVPPYHPRRVPLGERIRVSASLLEADPATTSFLAGELTRLRASALGRWLRPAGGAGDAGAGARGAGARGADGRRAGARGADARGAGAGSGPAQISLSAVIRERAVAFFPLDQSRYGQSARMIANLVALDTAAVFAESRRLGGAGDGLAWFGDADAIDGPALAALLSTGAQTGLATVLSTVSAQAAGRLAARANVLVIRGPADTSVADAGPAATALADTVLADTSPAGAPLDGTVLAEDQFALVISSPQQQVPLGRFVPGRMR
jgi:hypothetical protein